jgi:hypothetical protein
MALSKRKATEPPVVDRATKLPGASDEAIAADGGASYGGRFNNIGVVVALIETTLEDASTGSDYKATVLCKFLLAARLAGSNFSEHGVRLFIIRRSVWNDTS